MKVEPALSGVGDDSISNIHGEGRDPLSVVGDRNGKATDRHVRVANGLHLLDTMDRKSLVEKPEKLVESPNSFPRSDTFGHWCETDNIGEHDRHLRELIGNSRLPSTKTRCDGCRKNIQKQFVAPVLLYLESLTLSTKLFVSGLKIAHRLKEALLHRIERADEAPKFIVRRIVNPLGIVAFAPASTAARGTKTRRRTTTRAARETKTAAMLTTRATQPRKRARPFKSSTCGPCAPRSTQRTR